MSMKCSQCGASLTLSRFTRWRYAGKFFACPECGESKRLPPIKLAVPRRLLAASGFAAILVTVFLIVALRTWMPRTAGEIPLVNLIVPQDKELIVVRSWLKENSDAGAWEEVRWWPARMVSTHEGFVSAARLKYRTTSGLGKRLHDQIYVFDSSGGLDWSHDADVQWPVITRYNTENISTIQTVYEIVTAIDTGRQAKHLNEEYLKRLFPPPDDGLKLVRESLGESDDGFEMLRWWPRRTVMTRNGPVEAARMRWKVKTNLRHRSGDIVTVFRLFSRQGHPMMEIDWQHDFMFRESDVGHGRGLQMRPIAEEIAAVFNADPAQ